MLAGLAESAKAGWAGFGKVSLLEDGREEREVGSFSGRLGNLGWRVAGDADDELLGFMSRVSTARERRYTVGDGRRDIVRAEVGAIGVDGKRDVGTRVDEKPGFEYRVSSFC